MELKDVLYTISIVVSAVIAISGAYLSDTQFFQVYPDYDVRLFLEDTGNFTNKILLIENIEKVQAKDVKIFVNSDSNLTKDHDECVEGIIPNISGEKLFKIEFSRMSSNVPCNVMFVDYHNSNITNIMITSDSAPGKIYYPKTLLTDEDKITLSFLLLVFAENVKTTILFEEKDDNILDEYQELIVILAIAYIIGLMGAIIYKQSKKERIKKELTVEKNELVKQIERAEDRLDFYEKNSILNPTLLEQHYRDIEILKRDIISDNIYLDNIKSKINYRPLGHYPIDELFEKWQKLENMLMRHSFEKKITLRKSSTEGLFYTVFDKLHMPSQFATEFTDLYQFRNRLTHGQEKNTFHIKENVKKMNYFINRVASFFNEKTDDF